MTKQILSRKINSIKDELDRISNQLVAIDSTDITKYPQNYEELATKAALISENVTCSLRHLIYSTTDITKLDYLKNAAKEQNIKIDIKNTNYITITLPSLLPKRKAGKSSEFLTDTLYYSLLDFTNKNPIEKYKNCVICVSHVYNKLNFKYKVRDYDNIEIKQIVDVIGTFLFIDDNGLLCDIYQTTRLEEKECTIIDIIKKEYFLKWLENKKT